MIKLKIDVTKIEKARLFKGEKGTYLDVLLIETPNDKYGNAYMAVQEVTKEERLAGIKGPVLGNAKVFGQAPAPKPAATTTTTTMNAGNKTPEDDGLDVPF